MATLYCYSQAGFIAVQGSCRGQVLTWSFIVSYAHRKMKTVWSKLIPRPLRIEFPGAWYQVMNRGAGYRTIYKSDIQRKEFLSLLAVAHEMFGIQVHA